jgi:hypothetical protein
MLKKSVPVRIQRLNGEGLTMNAKGSDVRRGILRTIPHSNPLCRVTALELVGQEQELNYDKEKYREMLLEAAETVLGCFGFDSTIYATKTTKNKNRKWWHELREERIRDIETEGI